MEEHNRSLVEGEAGLDQGGLDQHRRNLHAAYLRQPANPQRKRGPFRLGRNEGRKRLCESRLHSNQRPMEPRWKNLEKFRRTRNELPYIKQKMQGSHNSQHPLATRQMRQPPSSGRLDQQPHSHLRHPSRLGLLRAQLIPRPSQRGRIQKNCARWAHSNNHQPGNHHHHRKPPPGQNSTSRKAWGDLQNCQGLEGFEQEASHLLDLRSRFHPGPPMGPRRVALVYLTDSRGRPLLWLHRQKKLQQRPETNARSQRDHLHTRPQPSEHLDLSSPCQNMAQRSPKESAKESPQHCLLECPMAQRTWKAYERLWDEWNVPRDLTPSWPFVLLGEAAMEHEDNPPGLLAYHTSDFTYTRQPLDILRSFILYHLWSERCRKHFNDHYSLQKVLLQAWVATVEVSMATWKAIRSHRPAKDPDTQLSIELAFRKEWLHLNILGKDNATIMWHYLPPMYYLTYSNV
ncbi:unnamed protein product [Sphagnum balticum]